MTKSLSSASVLDNIYESRSRLTKVSENIINSLPDRSEIELDDLDDMDEARHYYELLAHQSRAVTYLEKIIYDYNTVLLKAATDLEEKQKRLNGAKRLRERK